MIKDNIKKVRPTGKDILEWRKAKLVAEIEVENKSKHHNKSKSNQPILVIDGNRSVCFKSDALPIAFNPGREADEKTSWK